MVLIAIFDLQFAIEGQVNRQGAGDCRSIANRRISIANLSFVQPGATPAAKRAVDAMGLTVNRGCKTETPSARLPDRSNYPVGNADKAGPWRAKSGTVTNGPPSFKSCRGNSTTYERSGCLASPDRRQDLRRRGLNVSTSGEAFLSIAGGTEIFLASFMRPRRQNVDGDQAGNGCDRLHRVADCLPAAVHGWGYLQPILAYADGLSAILQAPGIALIILAGFRHGHHTTWTCGGCMLPINFVSVDGRRFASSLR
jgi:hypothetical protein